MLGWIFKNRRNAPGPATALDENRPPPDTAPVAAVVDWTAELAQARGDDAFLALLRTAGAPLQVKLAAVEALDGEAALKLVEREFRSHDRRVHQLAKRRLSVKVAQRQTSEQAARLIETVRSLVGAADVPVNRCVELDHAWQALDGAAIEPARREEFAALAAQLAAQVRQRTDIELTRKRWKTDAVQAQRRLQSACVEAAAGTQERAWLASAIGAAHGALQALTPEDAAALAADSDLADLRRALQIAAVLEAHLVVLERLISRPADTAAESAADAAAGSDAGNRPEAEIEVRDAAEPRSAVESPPVDDPEREWQALALLPEPQLAALLQARHARWRQARHDRESQQRALELKRRRGRTVEQAVALADGVTRAETALDEGKLADAHRYLSAIDDDLPSLDAPDALRARIAAAQARLAQLRGWQHWAGGRARDELVLQAEALAAATAAANQPNGENEGARTIDAEVARLSIRQRADLITTLRARWNEIDHVGGAGGRALWRRFDAALTAAGEPVATHVAAQRAARETNLSARRQLLEALEAMVVGAGAGPAESAAPAVLSNDATPPESEHEAPMEARADAHAWASALDRFHIEWRKLGPLEHTVPRAAIPTLVERMEAAVHRVETPLRAARHTARAEREGLVARARELIGGALGRDRDLVGEVRSLKAEWQRHAQALSLARADEQALWTDFKTAIDAAFAAREAHFSAREAELEAHAATRAALIKRLEVRFEDSPAVQRRTLAEVESAWAQCGPAPRARAAALDAEFRAARDAVRQRLDDAVQRDWQATCDALQDKLALCLAREQGAATDADDAARAASWQSLPALPSPLEQALRRRAGLASAEGIDTVADVDELLLQIETGWDLPTPTAFETARRERKLMAMKAALEGRRAGAPAALSPLAALALVLGRSSLEEGQSARLGAVLSAWRRRGPQRANDGA